MKRAVQCTKQTVGRQASLNLVGRKEVTSGDKWSTVSKTNQVSRKKTTDRNKLSIQNRKMDKRHSFIYSFVGSFIVPFIKNTEINEIQQKMFNEINYETIHIETKKHERKSKRVCALRIDDETKLVVFGCVGVVCG